MHRQSGIPACRFTRLPSTNGDLSGSWSHPASPMLRTETKSSPETIAVEVTAVGLRVDDVGLGSYTEVWAGG